MEPARPPRPQIPSVTLPPIPVTFPDINDMPLENLERLLNDEVAFSIYLRNMSQVKVRTSRPPIPTADDMV